MRFRLALLAIGVVLASFWLFLARPYSVVSDVGYQAFSARQFVDHYTAFNTIRLVNPRDLAKDILCPLTAWTPCWSALFVLAFKAGLSAGKAGRVLALLLSLTGALGWVWIVSLAGLKGWWRIAGVVLAALYCLRTGSVTLTGAGDQVIYAVAPWLIAAAAPLSVRLVGRPQPWLVARTALLSLALGSVYWLKYTGIFLSFAIIIAVIIEQFRGRIKARAFSSLLILALYGAVFVAPILALKAYNYRNSGSDFLESAMPHSPPRDVMRLVRFLSEAVFNAGTILFSTRLGVERIAGEDPTTFGWLVRAPGVALLALFLYVMFRQPRTYLRNVTILACVIPLAAFPALSFLSGPHFSYAMARCCDPYWILLELMILALLSQALAGKSLPTRNTRIFLAAATASQIVLFLWIPYASLREGWKIAHTPPYGTSAAELWDTDLSKYGTRDIDDRVRSLIRGPNDIIVPALYSNRAFATDTLLEFGGRLLPLSAVFAPLIRTHGVDGANYDSSAPFVSSSPLRIILVAPDPYLRDDFRETTERVKRRFTQVRQWKPGPIDPHGRVWIWTGEVL